MLGAEMRCAGMPEGRDNLLQVGTSGSRGAGRSWKLLAARSTKRAPGKGTGALSTLAGATWEWKGSRRRRGFEGGQDRSGGRLVTAGDAVVRGKTRPDHRHTHTTGTGNRPSEVSAADGEAIEGKLRGTDYATGRQLLRWIGCSAWTWVARLHQRFRRPGLKSSFQKKPPMSKRGIEDRHGQRKKNKK